MDERRRVLLAGVGLFAPVLLSCTRERTAVRAAEPNRADQERRDAERFGQAADLEETAVKVYQAAAGLPFIKADAAVLTTAGRFLSQHQEHRDTLIKAAKQLGQLALDPSKVKLPPLPPAILDASKPDAERKLATLRFARSLEMQAAKAYYVFITQKLETDYARKAAADILPVEAQHVAVYDMLLAGSTPAPTPFFSEQV